MPYPGHKSITLDEPTLQELEEWRQELKMRTTPELIRAIVRKKQKVMSFLYILRFSKAHEVS
jgi:hypothetical protein